MFHFGLRVVHEEAFHDAAAVRARMERRSARR